ncbi:hypothetical protein AVEN_194170-1 [Araneus ventricosus]|uniref:Uncharacterized protein n=1 Tax=Araneus ventricosus TaxID=182803 RepID=A0A4Y2U190_ARAVE|nr:hypothetical protein AVEN_194170-1 [Araneus ventricosus]
MAKDIQTGWISKLPNAALELSSFFVLTTGLGVERSNLRGVERSSLRLVIPEHSKPSNGVVLLHAIPFLVHPFPAIQVGHSRAIRGMQNRSLPVTSIPYPPPPSPISSVNVSA